MKPTSTSLTTSKPPVTMATMESLALQPELYWDGKTEPVSPPASELFSICEPIGNIEDNFAYEIDLLNDGDLDLKYNLELSPELINGDDLVLQFCDFKEEHWSETKQSYPQLLDYHYPIAGVVSNPNPIIKVQSPFDINAFGSANFDNSVLTQLTPPHSPNNQNGVAATAAFRIAPNDSQTSLNDVALHQTSTPVPVPVPVPVSIPATVAAVSTAATPTLSVNVSTVSTASTALPTGTPTAPATTPAVQSFHFGNWSGSGNQTPATGGPLITEDNDDIVRKMQIVDEIVSTRARELLDWRDECESQSSYSAPSQSDSATDEEWTPGSSYSSAGSSPMHLSGSSDEQMPLASVDSIATCSIDSSGVASAGGVPKKRTRAYARGTEDRKIRKKEQNKNAATRYRQKKKKEMEYVLSEEKELTQRNDELKNMLADCKREAKYLKTLIREFYGKKQ